MDGNNSECNQETMKELFQGIIDSTDELIETIGRMDWERIEKLGLTIAENASAIKILSGVN